MSTIAPRRGRPRKFSAPARPITLTLPEHVIQALQRIDADIGRAIVRLAQPAVARQPRPPAELVTYGRHAVIAIRPTPTLGRLKGVELVPLPDGRALISIDRPTTIAELELLIADVLDTTSGLSQRDRAVFSAIADILKTARRSDGVVLLQRSIIVLRSQARRRPPSRSPLHNTARRVSRRR